MTETQAELWKALGGDEAQEELKKSLSWLIQYWSGRNKYIDNIREALEGLNAITLPANTQYKAVAVHLYSLTAILNEKVSRYLSQPSYQVVIDNPTDVEAVTRSSRIEKALNVVSYEAERIGDGDVWNRVIVDAILLDEGVEKIEFAPNTFWRELISDEEENGVPTKYKLGSDARENYKKSKGMPIRKLYVPLENFLPSYDGPRLDFSFELEGRSLYSCLHNPLYADKKDVFQEASDGAGGRDIIVPIWHYCDDQFYAYFTTSSDGSAGLKQSLKVNEISVSDLIPLYIYRHGLGRSIYNPVAGRFGGWKTQANRIEGVNKGILSLNQYRDELMSQAATNFRGTHWTSFKFTVNPELRGFQQGGTLPAPPKMEEGGNITLFTGEDFEPIFKPQEDTTFSVLMDITGQQLSNLGGSTVLYGQRQPGVDTGYHNAQQVSQAEHLDEKVEQHAVQGAINEGTIIMLYAKRAGEKLWCHYSKEVKGGKKHGEYVYLDAVDLEPLPRLDARVRKPRPVDFIASVRAGRDASDERQGKGPLLSTQTIRQEILARESPDEEDALVRIEAAKNKIIASGILDQKIMERLNLLMVSQTPQPTAGQTASANPAALGAVQQVAAGQAAGAGGVNPDTLSDVADNLNIPDGGMTPTDSQPEARLGEMVAGAMGGRP